MFGNQTFPFEEGIQHNVRIFSLLCIVVAIPAQRLPENRNVALFQKLQPHRHIRKCDIPPAIRPPIVMNKVPPSEKHCRRLTDIVADRKEQSTSRFFPGKNLVFAFEPFHRTVYPLVISFSVNHTALRCHQRKIRIRKKHIHHSLQFVRREDVVVHQPLQIFAFGQRLERSEILSLRLRFPVPKIGNARLVLVILHQVRRILVRAVVRDNDLDIRIRLRKSAFQRQHEHFRTVVSGNHNGNKRERRRTVFRLFHVLTPSEAS